MILNDLINYIENPAMLREESIIDLTLLAEQYPYFQALQLLRVKNLHNIAPDAIKPILNYTAAYVTDRKILYYLLHPIQEKSDTEKAKPHEKQIKDTIRENIADTLINQKEYVEKHSGEEIEFSTSFDLRKEYGQGIELDEFVIRINNTEKEAFELIPEKAITEKSDKSLTAVTKPEEKPVSENKRPQEDILMLINKGVLSDDLNTILGEQSEEKVKKNSLIDNFLKSNPKIVPVKTGETGIHDISEESVKENEHLITDTLANIYLKQGHYAKAIFAYEKLSLKYPEKSIYFAARIEEIKKLKNH